MTGPLDLAALLELLGYSDPELLQVANDRDGRFSAAVFSIADVIALGVDVQDCNVWFGVNPVTPVDTGRPGAEHVTRLAALWADLDVKDRGCPDFATAHTIIDDLSGMLGARPVAITYSGHGLQPYWAIEGGVIMSADDVWMHRPDSEWLRSDARALLRRWGRLVANTAERRGAGIDSVFDLPRILRCPGSVNHKADPVPVVCLPDTGAPLDVDRILDTLDEYGIPDLADDHADPGAVVSAPAEWRFAELGCQYAPKVAQGWLTDQPADRHPWLVAQATRIAVMHRNGCLTEQARHMAIHYLTSRFLQLLGRPGQEREPGPGEVADALAWGQQRAAAMSDRQVAEELGRHQHHQPLEAPNGTPQRDLSCVPDAVLLQIPDSSPTLGGTRDTALPSDADPTSGLVDGEPAGPVPVTVHDLLKAALRPGDAPQTGPDGPGPHRETLGGVPGGPMVTAEPTPFDLAVDQAALNLWVQDEAKARERRRKAGTIDVTGQYLDATELGQLPKPDPLIAGVLNRHSLAILRGRDGTYKTFIALDWALSLAAGKPWQGVHTEHVKVLYIAGEGAYGIADRVAAWQHAWNTKLEPGQFTLRQTAVNLFVGGPLLDELLDRIAAGGYGLVVIDTLRRASGGADGNSTDMGVVIDNMARIKDATGHGSVLTLTHTDKGDNDTRGWSGIEDDTDIVWHVKRDEEEGPAFELVNTKMKDGPDGHKHILAARRIELPDGRHSLVIESAGAPVDVEYDTDQRVVAALASMFSTTGATVNELVEVLDMPKSTIYKVRGRLEKAGVIAVEKRGTGFALRLLSGFAGVERRGIEHETGVESIMENEGGRGTRIPRSPRAHSTPFHGDSTPDSTPFHAAAPPFIGGAWQAETWNDDEDEPA